MGRLQQAIGLQSGVMSGSGQQVEKAKQLLLQAEGRLAGLNQVLKIRQADLLLIEARREQRQTDEFAAMQHARNQLTSRTGENP
jgi:flagellar FliJ protein